MDFNLLFSIIALILSLLGNYLVAKKKIAAFPIWISANIMWIIVNLISNEPNYPMIIMYVVYTMFQVYALIQWKKDTPKNVYIYMVLMCTKITGEENPDLGDTKLVGYFLDKKSALRAIEHNIDNIYEHTYQYAIIKRFADGIYPVDDNSIIAIYKYDQDQNKYFNINMTEI